jgi:hypothetical protein
MMPRGVIAENLELSSRIANAVLQVRMDLGPILPYQFASA